MVAFNFLVSNFLKTSFLNIFCLFFFFFKGFSYLFIYLFIYLFLAVLGLRFVRGLSPVAASGGYSSCLFFSCFRQEAKSGYCYSSWLEVDVSMTFFF